MNDIISIRNSTGGSYLKPKLEDLDLYERALRIDQEALDYLKIKKNLSDDTISWFDIGFDINNQDITIPEKRNTEVINVAHLVFNKDLKQKYYKEKGCENWIFNEQAIQLAKTGNRSLLITGNQFDCMSCYQAGFKTTISIPVGKDAVGNWIELFDSIPKIYMCFENNKQSKKFGLEFAERLGIDKCHEIQLPEDSKDLNEYFRKHDSEEFKVLIKNARPYYKYTYQGLTDVIENLRSKKEEFITIDCIPFIEWEYGTTAVISGVTNIGKSSISLNVVNELVNKDIGCLVLPIERGIETAGKRFLQVRYKKNKDDLRSISNEEWEKIIPDVSELPVYFSNPKTIHLEDTIVKAKKLFNVKFIVIDHLDLLVRKSDGKNYNVEMSSTIQNICRIGQENNMIMLVVHHIKKQEGVASIPKKPSLNDLKGSGSVKDDPEIVIMLSEPDNGLVEVDILKNKGEMGSRIYQFNKSTGVVGRDVSDEIHIEPTEKHPQQNLNKF